MLPIAFKVRGGGNYSGTKGGTVRPNEKGGTGALWYIDKTFTIASTQDQFIATSTIKERTEQPMTTQPSTPQVPLRFLSVCSGMEAASVAWEPIGWKAVGFSEIEPFPCAVLAHRFPNTPNYGSLTEYQSWPLQPGSIDLLVGGTPCQSFSVAGLRKGLADPRGNLALVFLGLADKLKPRWIVWENVPGVLSSDGGRDFGSFLGALEQLGYGFAYRVLDAQHFGVPQRRRRVFVVACLGDWRTPAEVLSLREGLRGYLETGNKKRKSVAADVGAGVEADGLPIWRAGDQANAEHMIDHAGTVNCNKGSHGGFIAQPTIGTLCARDYKGVGNQYVQEGKCIPCPAPTPFRKSKRACSTTDNETWVPADASNTLNNFDLGDTRTTHAVVQPAIPIHDQATRHAGKHGDKQDGKGNGLGIGKPGDPMNTLTQGDKHAVAYHTMPGSVAPTIGASGPPYSRTGNERVEAEALAITFQPGSDCDKMGMVLEPNQVIPTLTARMQGSSGWAPYNETAHILPVIAPCITASNDPSRSPQSSEVTQQVAAVHQATMAVRRLTPVECERLQGFPDNWSQIPWKGKPADQCPDGPRYKCAGNSMAVPVMRWIGEQIARVELSLNNPIK